MTNPAGRDVDTHCWVRTTTERDITDDDLPGLTAWRHVLMVEHPVEDDNDVDAGDKVATMESFTIDPVLESDWFITMDNYSHELSHIAGLLLYRHPYDTLIAASHADARTRGADNGRFAVLSSLWTDPTHRGNGYGLSLLHEVIRTALRTSTFIIGEFDVFNDDQTRTHSFVELVKHRTRARQLEPDVLILP